jgi:hypothetical protein
MKTKIIKNNKQGSPSEYFCKDCLQPRLSLEEIRILIKYFSLEEIEEREQTIKHQNKKWIRKQ